MAMRKRASGERNSWPVHRLLFLPAGLQSSATERGVFPMSEDAFNMSIRKFLKEVGVTSQHKIEETVREGHLIGRKLKVRMTLTAEGIDLNHAVDGEIELP